MHMHIYIYTHVVEVLCVGSLLLFILERVLNSVSK